MNIEYLIVGIRKGSQTDFQDLYRMTATKVYALALATVKDKGLAREIAVETFRRVRTYAYSFDTNFDGEYWILDIARKLSLNALQDAQVSVPADASIDNASALILKTILQSKNDRGLILTLRALTGLSFKDIGDLSGYYTNSAKQEAKRGIAVLRAAFPGVSKKEVYQQLREDFKSSCPDYWDYILLDRPTKVAHISHETILLEGDNAAFCAETENARITERTQNQKNKRNRQLRVFATVCGVLIALTLGIALMVKLVQNSRTPDKETPTQTSAGIELVELNGNLYYRDGSSGIYAYQNGTISTIYEGAVRDLIAGGNHLFFRNYKNGQIYRLNPATKACVQISSQPGTSLAYYDGFVYYSNADGIYRFNANSDSPEMEAVYTQEVENAPSRYQMAFSNQGDLIFSAGADKGIYRVEENNLYTLYMDEAYYFQIQDNLLFFDTIGPNGKRQLQALSLTGKEEGAFFPTISLYSSAYYVVGNTVYYEGTGDTSNQNGLYKMNLSDGSTALIQEIQENELHITHIYATEDTLYCYYSDGLSNGENKLTCRAITQLDTETEVFYHTTIKK
ncbi:MAG: hypothetical protein IKU26_07320 [Clostridia bacterium]|nr:hypothetical protein [Clostridia bacterium]